MASSRLRLSDARVGEILRGLTDRDHLICTFVWEHSVLTTDQIAEACFDTLARAQVRLQRLHQLGLVDRFRPYRSAGSAPFHYVLGSAGPQSWPPNGAWRSLRSATGLSGPAVGDEPTPRPSHRGQRFFTALMGTARRSGGTALLAEWWSERRCSKAMGGLVRPDGYGVWRRGGRRSSSAGARPRDRAGPQACGQTRRVRGPRGCHRGPALVLFWFPSARREAEARRTLGATPVPVATAAAEMGRPADDAIWLPVGEEAPGSVSGSCWS